MFIYNLTIQCDQDVFSDLWKWLNDSLIESVEEKTTFTHCRTLELMFDPNPGRTLAIQFETDSLESIDKFNEASKSLLEKMIHMKYEGKVVCFGTFLEDVQ